MHGDYMMTNLSAINQWELLIMLPANDHEEVEGIDPTPSTQDNITCSISTHTLGAYTASLCDGHARLMKGMMAAWQV